MTPVEKIELRMKKINETTYRRAVGREIGKTNDEIIILKYLKGTIKYDINISKNSNIKVSVDVDYAEDVKTRKTTTGFVYCVCTSTYINLVNITCLHVVYKFANGIKVQHIKTDGFKQYLNSIFMNIFRNILLIQPKDLEIRMFIHFIKINYNFKSQIIIVGKC
ncbi:hypothetical protein PIROE2DRAFT_6116 [Piromyces sp. E2]|nr:hypothetical protein PIROE2DRAFT_6116 [Piromyces sp. E2]|eukprot:OUM66593.1 hypothetical protein PIROE2DRAFT_6116 [Piromyces sp. E2]